MFALGARRLLHRLRRTAKAARRGCRLHQQLNLNNSGARKLPSPTTTTGQMSTDQAPAAARLGMKDCTGGCATSVRVIVREEVPGQVVVGFLDLQTVVRLMGKPAVEAVADQRKVDFGVLALRLLQATSRFRSAPTGTLRLGLQTPAWRRQPFSAVGT